ncbi:hypothetical protein [Aeoliella mucimassa]|uniref:Laminin G domain protein n=1 Tax=Aeoliella mucimassa TaxID=2527972 RepID=A0A518ATZ5_9BACT|nr:hypothetical protein [Aeoliella mucimassa]QDU58200.1 hypothetical protein Pan181_44330 [Aeoliella mucimassa]
MPAYGRTMATLAMLILLLPTFAHAEEESPAKELETVAKDDFETNSKQWEFLDSDSWQYTVVNDRGILSQYVRESDYKPPHRSPLHVALLKEHAVSDFELTVSVRSTVEEYPHRDACLFFGYVDSAHFYYVHLGKLGDPHCNQIFIVNGADRKAISVTTTEGTPWDDEWHRVKIVRDVESGKIEIYFDDFKTPAMTAEDTTFKAGRVGVGSFDDCADWDDFELRGVPAEVAESAEAEK